MSTRMLDQQQHSSDATRNGVTAPSDAFTHFLLRGIQQGEMSYAAELAQCLGLDLSLVTRMLAYLAELGLVQGEDGALMLTEPGQAVLRQRS